jgi:hypothetical protein
LKGAARRLGFTYTRYADDLTFSLPKGGPGDVGKLLRLVRFVVRKEGFVPHPEKTRVLRRGGQQEVTGIVVNDKLGVDRETLRRFRALLHQLEKSGPEGKKWNGSTDVIASAVGFANYVAMVDPAKGKAFQEKARALEQKYGRKRVMPPRPKAAPPAQPGAAAEVSKPGEPTDPNNPPKKKWWKVF